MQPHSRHSGFTLLEITIVLSIIALLAAAITVGRTMIENAALQSIVADVEMYKQAVLNYRDKYEELPGDHSNASSVTSEVSANCTSPAASDAMSSATCNGNGDGFIGDSTGDPFGAFTNYHEPLLMWQHLVNAGFISGKYNGRRSTAATEITPEINVPLSRISNAAYLLRYFPTNTVTTGYFQANYGHALFLGSAGADASLPLNGGALTPEQAKSIDLKMDDGKPGLGSVLTSPALVPPACITTSVETTAAYNGSITTPACALIFITGF